MIENALVIRDVVVAVFRPFVEVRFVPFTLPLILCNMSLRENFLHATCVLCLSIKPLYLRLLGHFVHTFREAEAKS